jgi:hypothetical protein
MIPPKLGGLWGQRHQVRNGCAHATSEAILDQFDILRLD